MLQRIIPFGHQILTEFITKNDVVIDATCGNGNDTLFLAKIAKQVYAFDIQEVAINNTKQKLQENNILNVQLIQQDHQLMDQFVEKPVKAVVFNLGYLPGGDPQIISKAESTKNAIEKGLSLLQQGGIVLITLYIGHVGGLEEAEFIERYATTLPTKHFSVLKYQFLNTENAPYIIIIEKKKGK